MTPQNRLPQVSGSALIGLVLTMTTLFSACGQAPSGDSSGRQRDVPRSEHAEFLLSSAAADFRSQREPRPARFRNVRSGQIVTAGGAQYRLCGEFLPEGREETGEWVPFVTLRTSPYEQWLGGQALPFCQDAAMTWDESDLSAVLLDRLKQVQ